MKKDEFTYDIKKVHAILRGEEPTLNIYQNNFVKSFDKLEDKINIDGVEYEVFTDSEKKYIKRNGVNVDIKFFENSGVSKLTCPKCKKIFSHKFDKFYYSKTNMCYSCFIKFQTEMLIEDKWYEYEEEQILKSKLSFAKETLQTVNDILNGGIKKQYSYVKNESGEVEYWENEKYSEELEFFDKEKKYLENIIELIQKYLNKEITAEEYDEKIKK